MADVINRLKMETTQYDSKLRDAAQKLKEFGRAADKAGADFGKLSRENMDLAKSFGAIATSGATVKDRLKELVAAYNDVARAYNGLTKEQQQSDFGKAMAQSLDQLKGRIAETKQEMQNVGGAMKDTGKDGNALGGVLEKVAGKFGVNTSALGALGIALGSISVALKVAKDAFLASEANVDQWGRTLEAGKSIYEGFLFALNTGDFSGFLSNINQISAAAAAAYDALDRLGTMQRIMAPGISSQQVETDRLRQMLQTGTYIAPTDGRKPTPGMTNGQRLSQDQLRTVERQLQGSIQRQVGMQVDIVKQTNDAIDKWYNKLAKQMGMTAAEFRKGTSSMAEFDKRVKGAQEYRRWQDEHSYVDQSTGRLVSRRTGNPNAQFRGWDVFRVDGKEYGELVNLIKQRDQQAAQVVSMQAQGFRAINRVEGYRPTLRATGGGGGGARGGGVRGGGTTAPQYVPVEGSIDKQAAKVQALQKAWRAAADDDSRKQIKAQLDDAQAALDKMEGKQIKMDAPVGSMQYYQNWLKELQEKQQLVTNNSDWEYYAGQIDFVTKKMKELQGTMEEKPAEGSMKYYSEQLKDLQDQQQNVTSTEEWKDLGKQIDEVSKKIKKLTGELGGSTSSKAIGEKIEELNQSLSLADIGSSDYSKIFANIIDAKTFQNVITAAAQQGIDMAALGINNEALWDAIIGGNNIPDDVWQSMLDTINEKRKKMNLDPLSLNFQTGDVSTGKTEKKDNLVNKVSKLTDGISTITGGLENIGIKIPNGISMAVGVMQSLISVINGVQTVISIFSTTSQTLNTAAVNANTFAIGGLIAALETNTITNLIPGFANGGIVEHAANGMYVPGRSYTGDKVPIMADSGELILNRAAQGNIASQLVDGAMGNIVLEARIHGEDIILSSAATNRRRGKSEAAWR